MSPPSIWNEPSGGLVPRASGPWLDYVEQNGNKNEYGTQRGSPQAAHSRMRHMVRLARESLAFVSVASFVWMVCQVAVYVG
jgi:hypothetical protein